MLIGILSDTHGLLRQEVIDAFKGVDHIIHAGDIDNKAVIDKNLNGCYECEPAGCRKGLFAEKIKPRAFAEFARRYGIDELLDCLERNEKAGIVYHREGIMGDYDDFDDLEELITFIRTGSRCSM